MRPDYWKRLSFWFRWMLPPTEAAEVIADYRDMLQQNPRSEKELYRDMGSPYQAARLLVQRNPYLRWMAVFCSLAGLLIFIAFAPFLPPIWRFFSSSHQFFATALSLAALLLSLILSRRQEQGENGRPLPRGLLLLVSLLLAGAAGTALLLWRLAAHPFLLPPRLIGQAARLLLETVGLLSALAGVFGLIQARLDGRRWWALYLLGLTLALLSLSVLALLTAMNLDFSVAGWWRPYLLRFALICAVGLAGTGAALC